MIASVRFRLLQPPNLSLPQIPRHFLLHSLHSYVFPLHSNSHSHFFLYFPLFFFSLVFHHNLCTSSVTSMVSSFFTSIRTSSISLTHQWAILSSFTSASNDCCQPYYLRMRLFSMEMNMASENMFWINISTWVGAR